MRFGALLLAAASAACSADHEPKPGPATPTAEEIRSQRVDRLVDDGVPQADAERLIDEIMAPNALTAEQERERAMRIAKYRARMRAQIEQVCTTSSNREACRAAWGANPAAH